MFIIKLTTLRLGETIATRVFIDLKGSTMRLLTILFLYITFIIQETKRTKIVSIYGSIFAEYSL